ncbi:MAG: topoisomerase IV, partial [Clostridia bacterium]|nr:topoisomerase IV [Clostridia bacterium]
VRDIMVFTDKCQVYKASLSDFDTVKASSFGEYLAPKLNFDEDERPVMVHLIPEDNSKDKLVFLFENGKGVRIPLTAYETKSNRRRLTGAYSSASPIAGIAYEENGESVDIYMENNVGKAISFKSSLIPEKATRSASGVTVFALKKGQSITRVESGAALEEIPAAQKCRKIKLPATGVNISK